MYTSTISGRSTYAILGYLGKATCIIYMYMYCKCLPNVNEFVVDSLRKLKNDAPQQPPAEQRAFHKLFEDSHVSYASKISRRSTSLLWAIWRKLHVIYLNSLHYLKKITCHIAQPSIGYLKKTKNYGPCRKLFEENHLSYTSPVSKRSMNLSWVNRRKSHVMHLNSLQKVNELVIGSMRKFACHYTSTVSRRSTNLSYLWKIMLGGKFHSIGSLSSGK